jgi:hypothetical protein
MRRRDRSPSDADLQAAEQRRRGRRARAIEVRLATWGVAADPPNPDGTFAPLRAALARARALPPGQERYDAIEAVGREFVGDELVDRWLASSDRFAAERALR